MEEKPPSTQSNTVDKIPSPTPLATQVKESIEHYFSQLNGHDASGVYAMVISEVEKPLIQAVLNHCGYNQTKASKVLGLSRSTLRKKIEVYNLS